jgi:hypothetical protein
MTAGGDNKDVDANEDKQQHTPPWSVNTIINKQQG